jgi:hypothetical protein
MWEGRTESVFIWALIDRSRRSAGPGCATLGCENGPADTSQLIEREGYEDSQGVVTDVPPLHGVEIDEVLRSLQKQPQEAHGDDAADLLTAGSGDEEQQECRTRKRQDVDSAMLAHKRRWPDGLQGTEDQEQ